MIPMPLRDAPVWNDREPLECMMVIPEAPDVMTFSFRPPSGATFHFRAGQFITLDLPLPQGTVQRTYTISSSPVTNSYITVTVKAQPGSLASRWMIDHLRPGMRIPGPWSRWLLSPPRAARREVPVHLGRVGRHADDVHGHDAV